MQFKALTIVRHIGVIFLAVALVGCAATGRKADPVIAGSGATVAQTEAASKDAGKTAEAEAKEKEKKEEEEAKDARQLAKLQRDIAIAHERVAKAHMDQAHTRARHDAALADAERELALAADRLRIFNERTAPNRINRARLDLTRAEDRTKEAEEELRQLEMMYAEEDFADQTKEIVLERGRRRLERTHRDLELHREELATLTDRTIPLETAEHELRVEQKTRARDKAGRDAESSMLDKHIAVMAAEAEVPRLEAEIAALEDKMERRRIEREKED